MQKSLRICYQLATAAACLALASCSAKTEEEPVIANALKLSFDPMYSAYDGVRDYQLPVVLEAAAYDPKGSDPIDVSTLKWRVDTKFVKQQEYPELQAATLLTTTGAGKTIVTAEAKSRSGRTFQGTAVLNITKADPAEWELGDKRYNDQVPLLIQDSSAQEALASMGIYYDQNASCANCHHDSLGQSISGAEMRVEGAPTGLPEDITVQHTPQQTAGYSDDELIQIFTHGKKPAGSTFHSPLFDMIPDYYAEMAYKEMHTWTIAPEVERGLVYKLRSLTPKTQETVDWDRIFAKSEAFAQAQQDDSMAPPAPGSAGSGM